MKNAFRLIHARAKNLAEHRLFVSWLHDDSITIRQKLVFVPMAIDFIMGFRDFNRYYVRYPNPTNALEEALNTHAEEDETHSALLLEDWVTLRIDDLLGWAPRDLYWWMTSDATATSRRADWELMSLVYHNEDPLLRFVIIEAMEAAGQVFFQRTVPIVQKLRQEIPGEYRYFGEHHLHRETGHLQNADEKIFLRGELSTEDQAKALVLVNRVFDIFEIHFGLWESFARSFVNRLWTNLPVVEARAAAAMRDDRPSDVSQYLSLDWPRDLTGPAKALADSRRQCADSLWALPAYRWMREQMPGDFKGMTRLFLLQWIVDNWACADYFAFDTTYAEPATALERGINRLSILYGSEMKRRYVEWETLQFDDFTGFTLAEALGHYWLDPMVERHREVFASLRKLTFRFPKALHRYWILKCFVRFGDTLMHSLGVAMKAADELDESFITFAGQPERLHPNLIGDEEADRAIAELERQAISPEDQAIIETIIAETFAQERERADLTWQVIESKRYVPMQDKWRARPKSSGLRRKVGLNVIEPTKQTSGVGGQS